MPAFGTPLPSAKNFARGLQDVPSSTPIARASKDSGVIVNKAYTVVLAADNTPQQAPGFQVPDGCAVRVRANNGTTAGNAAVIFIAGFPSAFKAGHGTPLAPLDDVAWPSQNGAHIWIYGKKGDGVVISVITTVLGNS